MFNKRLRDLGVKVFRVRDLRFDVSGASGFGVEGFGDSGV